MNKYAFTFCGTDVEFLSSGALFWPARKLLCVSDLHLGRSERYARLAGALLPPYETRDTLARLEAAMAQVEPQVVVCLGDSFDDAAAEDGLDDEMRLWLTRLMAGRRWIWIEGNHDPGPVEIGGSHMAELPDPPLTFRHIAREGAAGEVSGHYHPKARVTGKARPCLIYDSDRIIMPAFGTYTGGLRTWDAALSNLMRPEAVAILTGPKPIPMPMPR
ncbi:ligase-associated DNA damage response endonuclease PdeM [Maritimibacter dapengensis]|uniref:Ligase-associated DNA damage response endonuclease PdeM n=1 Tax=Maritimibacter dapengensis TaxID=2836868 RepID=A0ABS6SYV9_9RHOB|nr:ligase-associated DNA damage response endonuclease PdeM [Maritimibacter dapengensis]MBV7378110.1 ligase-associated DNA damage response endonuclease PdeM [Maritimibacter dapengensis]